MAENQSHYSTLNSQHDAVGAWFFGPKGENLPQLKEFFNYIVDEQQKARENYFEHDSTFITKEMQESSAFNTNMNKLKRHLDGLTKLLAQHSVPFWSPRYNAHMSMDTSMPAIVGYLLTMLYNPNNVSTEASPLTTRIEIEVGLGLCKMLGYNVNRDSTTEPVAWGHIACDGSVANLESMWAARNLKFYPLSLRNAIADEAPLAFIAQSFKVVVCNGQEKLLIDCSTWELLNLKASTILDLPHRLYVEYGISSDYLQNVMNPYIIQTVSKDKLEKQFGIDMPAQYFVGTTKHYSWPKAAAVTGIGSENVIDVPVDNAARMDSKALDKLLSERLANRQAVYAVVAIMGSTEQGAVDPLSEVYKLRQKYEPLGLTFVIHADAAWGGYFASILRPRPLMGRHPGDSEDPDNQYVPELALQPYTKNELDHFKFADSITIDPHKSGYVPYPAGGLCYRDERMRYLVTWTSPIMYRTDGGESVGIYGIEGSKPGAAAVATFLSHSVIGLHRGGYGALLGEAIFSCTKLYSHWVTMTTKDSELIVVPFNMLPTEKEPKPDPAKIDAQKTFIRDYIVNRPNLELIRDEKASELLRELGSDLLINTFACNFRINGKVNEDVVEANYLNTRIFERLSIQKISDKMADRPIIVTSSVFNQKQYGECLTNFKRRLGLKGDQDLYVLVNVVMSPFPTEGNFTRVLATAFQEVAEEEIKACRIRNQVTPDQHGFIMQGTDKLHLVHLPMFNMANHRYQLIITGDVPPEVIQKYVEARKADPEQLFTLGTVDKEILSEILKRGSFKAVINKGLSPGVEPFISDFELTNICIIKQCGLDSKYLDPSYPQQMPFYLYGTLEQQHIDHMLLSSPNTQLNSDDVNLNLDRKLSKEDLEKGLIMIMDSIHEQAMQPFPSATYIASEPNFFFRQGRKHDVTVYRDPHAEPQAYGPGLVNNLKDPIARGSVTLGPNLFVDSEMVNMDPALVPTHGALPASHHIMVRGPMDTYHQKAAVLRDWKTELYAALGSDSESQ